MWPRFLVTLFLVSLAVGLAYQQLERPSLGIDDAHIFFVYGQNIAAGHGVVYNAGGERVEGFSSPLWLLFVSIAFSLSNQPELWLLVLAIVLVAVAVAILWHFVDGSEKISWRGFLLLAWVLSSPGYIIWMSLTLMDSALWSALLILTTVAVLRGRSHRWRLAGLLALLVWARPEALAWGPFFIGLALWMAVVARGWRTAIVETMPPLLTFVAAQVALLLLRLAYFGYPLPNTYYAKVSPDLTYNLWHGLLYLLGFLNVNKQLLLLVAPLVAGLLLNLPWLLRTTIWPAAIQLDRARRQYVAVSLVALTGLALPISTGGDHFGLYRFYQPVWPLLILPAFSLVAVLREQWPPVPRALRYGFVALATAVFLLVPLNNWFQAGYRGHIQREFAIARDGRELGRVLNTLFQPDLPVVGVITSGGFAVTYQGEVFDVMGLNHIAMAQAPGNRYGVKNHAAFNGEVFLNHAPDLFIPETAPADGLPGPYWAAYGGWYNQVLQGFLKDDRFNEQYEAVLISNGDIHITTYVRRDYLTQLHMRDLQVMAVTIPE
jgi:arabinofuranosyltransferase